MTTLKSLKIAGLVVLLFFSCTPQKQSEATDETADFYEPWESLGPLFHDVQMAGVFPDSKTFVDCTPKSDPATIASDYLARKDDPDFDLKAFVSANFIPPSEPEIVASREESLKMHLENHWKNLTRKASESDGISTLIPLPGEYVVPGGRFREIYYWDSYFTLIGLGASGRTDLVEAMVDNFAYLIDTVGFIPNGNRTYYLGRSQPPFFASMVNLYAQLTSVEEATIYLPAVQKEYDFWMQGSEYLSSDLPAVNRVVRLSDGTILNRYWDFLDFPRPESHKEDYELAEGLSDQEQKKLYRNLRAGAESGWDYSTRWFQDKADFGSIRTTDMLPVDLNSLMFAVETTLANLYAADGKVQQSDFYSTQADQRKAAIQRLFWDADKGAFTDYIWTENRLSDQLTLAGAYPLYFIVASAQQADAQARVLESDFLLPGGVVTTTIESGQQWDYPNGWAPLQWMTIKGLEHYDKMDLATEIKTRWLRVNDKVYQNTGKMMEKYNVADTTLIAGGGEYPTQDGFGWSNGVALGLMSDNVAY